MVGLNGCCDVVMKFLALFPKEHTNVIFGRREKKKKKRKSFVFSSSSSSTILDRENRLLCRDILLLGWWAR